MSNSKKGKQKKLLGSCIIALESVPRGEPKQVFFSLFFIHSFLIFDYSFSKKNKIGALCFCHFWGRDMRSVFPSQEWVRAHSHIRTETDGCSADRQTQSHTRTRAHWHKHRYANTQTPLHTHTRTHTLTQTLKRTNTPTQPQNHANAHAYTHTHTHTRAHNRRNCP